MVAVFAALLLGSLTATATVDQKTVTVGEEVHLEVAVSGSSVVNASVQEQKMPDGLELGPAQGPSMQRMAIAINGRLSQSEKLVWTYALTATRSGSFRVPPFLVRDGTETASTAAFTITATGSFDPRQYAGLSVRVDPRPRYVGEPITVDVVPALRAEWVDRLVSGETRLRAPWITAGLGNGALPEPEGSPAPNTPGAISIGLSDGPDVPMTKGMEKRGEDNWATWTLRRSFIPVRAGTVTVGATTFHALIATRVEREFLSNALRAAETKLASVDSPAVKIEVKPLPDAGRPDDFSGLVGRLSLTAEASPHELKVGDTVRVKVKVSGEGNLSSTALPRADVPGFKRFGAVEEVDSGADAVTRTLTYDLAPISTDITAIPPFSVPFFDTASGTYRVLHSDPIPIRVKPGALVAAIKDSPTPTPEPHHEGAARASSEEWPALMRRAAPWAAAAAAPLLAMAVVLARRRARAPRPPPPRRGRARRNLTAALEALPRERRREGAAALALAFGRYLADLTERPPEAFVGTELEASLKPFVAEVALREEAAALVAEAEAVAFGHGTAAVGEMKSRAEALAARLDAAIPE